jgi:tetratricopeptide (TPR) repeat protein
MAIFQFLPTALEYVLPSSVTTFDRWITATSNDNDGESSVDSTSNSVLVSSLNNKGVGFLENREFASAKDSLRKALLVVTSDQDDESNEAAARYLKHDATDGIEGLVVVADDLDASGPILSALSIPATRSDATTKSDDYSSVESASKYLRHRSEYDEGMDFFSEPLLLNHESACVDAVILFNLGRVHHEQGKFENALSCYRQSLFILENSHTCDMTTTLANLFNIGNIQYSSGDFVDALKTFNEALDFSQTAFGPGSMEVAACLNCIGLVHYIDPHGDSDRALEAFSMSLNLRRQTGIRDCHLGTV